MNIPLQECIDLHIHSTASDGTDTPAQIVKQAAGLGLSAIALTDHDTVDGVTEAKKEAASLGLEFIAGCELGAHVENGEMHIVALWVKEDDAELRHFLQGQQNRRNERNQAILKKLSQFGINFDVNIFKEHTSVGRPHIARALVDMGIVSSIQEAFKKYLSITGKAYVPRRLDAPDKILRKLKSLKATTIIAHPMSINVPKSWLEQTVADFVAEGILDGLEAYHPEHDAGRVAYVEKLAKKHGLLLSGGSDYHGLTKKGIRLGEGKGNLRISKKLLDLLKERRLRQGLWV